jgi:hypothetical protein
VDIIKIGLPFRALGRNHIASTPISGHRNAMF